MKTTILVIATLIRIQFTDVNTGETLPGVRVETKHGTSYTDSDGYMNVNKGDTLLVSYISYKDTSLITTDKTATIGLSNR